MKPFAAVAKDFASPANPSLQQDLTPQTSTSTNTPWHAVNNGSQHIHPLLGSEDEIFVDDDGHRHVETDNGADETYLINAAKDSFAGVLDRDVTHAELAEGTTHHEAERKLAHMQELQVKRWVELLRMKTRSTTDQPPLQAESSKDNSGHLAEHPAINDLIRRIISKLEDGHVFIYTVAMTVHGGLPIDCDLPHCSSVERGADSERGSVTVEPYIAWSQLKLWRIVELGDGALPLFLRQSPKVSETSPKSTKAALQFCLPCLEALWNNTCCSGSLENIATTRTRDSKPAVGCKSAPNQSSDASARPNVTPMRPPLATIAKPAPSSQKRSSPSKKPQRSSKRLRHETSEPYNFTMDGAADDSSEDEFYSARSSPAPEQSGIMRDVIVDAAKKAGMMVSPSQLLAHLERHNAVTSSASPGRGPPQSEDQPRKSSLRQGLIRPYLVQTRKFALGKAEKESPVVGSNGTSRKDSAVSAPVSMCTLLTTETINDVVQGKGRGFVLPPTPPADIRASCLSTTVLTAYKVKPLKPPLSLIYPEHHTVEARCRRYRETNRVVHELESEARSAAERQRLILDKKTILVRTTPFAWDGKSLVPTSYERDAARNDEWSTFLRITPRQIGEPTAKYHIQDKEAHMNTVTSNGLATAAAKSPYTWPKAHRILGRKRTRQPPISPPLWCYCQLPDDGSVMVECGAKVKCPVQWFHLRCLGLTDKETQELLLGSAAAVRVHSRRGMDTRARVKATSELLLAVKDTDGGVGSMAERYGRLVRKTEGGEVEFYCPLCAPLDAQAPSEPKIDGQVDMPAAKVTKKDIEEMFAEPWAAIAQGNPYGLGTRGGAMVLEQHGSKPVIPTAEQVKERIDEMFRSSVEVV
ncbi:hypothetical protein W97_01511 [Coniosporium apollinis CBS 100218]|uniref:Zinc finger PHD-type domain-containing protein n=1 Tax=Coniosporium apollinis (strain CBS 100218) TaxID=1168221 RepID=R7YK61_CONA1|nr:uncharacterized protein W97_01511 [Coniosporium apollinis CBS 100218]EON62290.1 hypothetical protein W97_01511 [Coniosporium apollinis CBS 100218]